MDMNNIFKFMTFMGNIWPTLKFEGPKTLQSGDFQGPKTITAYYVRSFLGIIEQ